MRCLSLRSQTVMKRSKFYKSLKNCMTFGCCPKKSLSRRTQSKIASSDEMGGKGGEDFKHGLILSQF